MVFVAIWFTGTSRLSHLDLCISFIRTWRESIWLLTSLGRKCTASVGVPLGCSCLFVPQHACSPYRSVSTQHSFECDQGRTWLSHCLQCVHSIPPCSSFLTFQLPAASNRLDRLTSGLMVVALSSAKATSLAAEFFKGTVGKEYIAMCEGNFPEYVYMTLIMRRTCCSHH